MVLVSLLAAIGWVFSKESLTAMTPLFFLAVRFIAAALVVGMFDLTAFRTLSKAQIRRAVVTGIVLGVQSLVWILGLYYTDHIGVGGFLVSLAYVLTPVVGTLLFGVRTHLHTWIAISVAFVGLGFLSLHKGFDPSLSDLLFLASAVIYAFYFNFNSRYSTAIPAIPLTAIQLAVVGALTLVASVLSESPPGASAFSVLGWVLASIFIATALRFFLFVKAQASVPVAHGAVIMTLGPVWTALLGAIWFNESMSSVQLLGCALIFSALMINAWGSALRVRRLLGPAQSSAVNQ